ncbi:DUF3824 domain-containing protein [Streptomyces brasiliensis]|nr:DUF3824 domain-containing protein [Streptomyces brasiliensis]
MFQGDSTVSTPPPPQGPNPYAQTPPPPAGQQPYGQPGVPPQQPYAPFPNQGAGAPVPPPAAPPKRSKKAVRIIGAIVVFIVIAAVKFGIGFGIGLLDKEDAETTSAGASMHNNGTESSPDLKEVDCTSSDAQYKVVQKFDDSTDTSKCESVTESTIAYVQYRTGHKVVLCLKGV